MFYLLLVFIFADDTPLITQPVTHFYRFASLPQNLNKLYLSVYNAVPLNLSNYMLVSINFPLLKCIHLCASDIFSTLDREVFNIWARL